MDNNKLIRFEGGLIQRVGNAISTTNKLLALTERQKIIAFFIERPDFFISFISRYYPFNENLLAKYSGIWDWELISLNENILWSEEIIEKYSPLFNWNFLSQNGGIQWGNGFIEKYKIRIEWSWLSGNKILPSSQEIVGKYFDSWNWKILSQNCGLPWTPKFIEKYKHKWDWGSLSSNGCLPWTFELIESFIKNWNWSNLRWNNKFLLDTESLKKYSDQENCFELLYRDTFVLLCTFPFKIDMLEIYKNREKGIWQCLSLSNNLPWSIELIEKYKENWVWEYLSLNTNLPWSIELIEKYKENWVWECMFSNKSIPWSLKILEIFNPKRVVFHSQKYDWKYYIQDFEEINIYNYEPIWNRVFKDNIDDSIIYEAIGQKILEYGENKYILKKLDNVWGGIEFILKSLEGSYGSPKFSKMFLSVGYDDVFEMMIMITKFVDLNSFWLSNELKTILKGLNLFLHETCSSFNKKTISQEELWMVGRNIFDRTEVFRSNLKSQYENDTKRVNIIHSLNRINNYYKNV